ncbi:hypothetical protein [Mesorhizobium sp. IMUNJ 23232]|uniref:hypothetical protein n=1 Tax=Mesorhizobium sp. IMUNJ 23232 TaxID=3376064 RepID=UPI0037A630EB
MDAMIGRDPVENYREALKRIVAGLVAMVEMGAASLVSRGCVGGMVPRHLHRAVLSLLRPAESAARRLVIVLSRGLVVTVRPPRSRKARPKRTSIYVRDGVGTGIVLRPGMPVPGRPVPAGDAPLSFPLLDPLKRLSGRHRRVAPRSVPRIWIAGVTERLPVPVRKPPLPDDPLDAGRLGRRLAALARVLDDLPGQAQRLARWKARNDAARARVKQGLEPWKPRRVSPLRGGPAPGGRLRRFDPDAPRRKNIREIDEILVHAHAMAHHVLNYDTS